MREKYREKEKGSTMTVACELHGNRSCCFLIEVICTVLGLLMSLLLSDSDDVVPRLESDNLAVPYIK